MFLFLEGFQPEMFLLSSFFSSTFLAVNGCLCSSTLDPRPSAPISLALGPKILQDLIQYYYLILR